MMQAPIQKLFNLLFSYSLFVSLEVYPGTDMAVGVHRAGLVAAADLLQRLMAVDPRGGMFSQDRQYK